MITSTSNQQMKNLMLLMKKAKARNEQELFVVEGRKMFQEVPEEWLKQVYVSESFFAENDKMLAGYTYEIVSDSVFKAVSDTQTPQGILCLVRKPQYRLEELLKGADTHLLILESIQDPGNLGTMLRTGEGAGISGVVMNHTTVDLFNPKTIRSTMGSIYRMPFFVTRDLAETICELKNAGVKTYAAHLKGKMQYDEPDYTGATALDQNRSSARNCAVEQYVCLHISLYLDDCILNKLCIQISFGSDMCLVPSDHSTS